MKPSNGLTLDESINDPTSRIAHTVALLVEKGAMTKNQLLMAMYGRKNVNSDFLTLAVQKGILCRSVTNGLTWYSIPRPEKSGW